MAEFVDPCPAGGVYYDGPFPGAPWVPCTTCQRMVAVSAGRLTDHTRIAEIVPFPGTPLTITDDGQVYGHIPYG